MKSKFALLSRLALSGVWKNKTAYMPYILMQGFSVFLFFIFFTITTNEMLQNVPRAMYVIILLNISLVLLGIILIPVLVSSNRFLLKQRKKEIGLYHILGMEKTNIGTILTVEQVIVFVISMLLGLIFAVVFSRLVFMILLRVSDLPQDIVFSVKPSNFIGTLSFFMCMTGYNIVENVFLVSRIQPIELLHEGRKGEKEHRFIWLKALIGIGLLGWGYKVAVTMQVNSMIFLNFFLAVFLVVSGTRLCFTSGSILILKFLQKRKKIYYKLNNFTTISGMLYRMRKSATSLSNICIFSTMIMITIICTVCLYRGQDGAIRSQYPMDCVYEFNQKEFSLHEEYKQKIEETAERAGVEVAEQIEFTYARLKTRIAEEGYEYYRLAGSGWDYENTEYKIDLKDEAELNYWERQDIRLITVEDLNRVENTEYQLNDDEVLVYSNTKNIDREELLVGEKRYHVKEELKSLKTETKEADSIGEKLIYVVFANQELVQKIYEKSGDERINGIIYTIQFQLHGEKQNKEYFVSELNQAFFQMPGANSVKDIYSWEEEIKSMNGGLLFIGIFFGIIFSCCMLIIMYYKQVTEGYEDKYNYEIMKKVGMSEDEIRGTIIRQVIYIFAIPLAAAIIHTIVALNVIKKLMAVLSVFDKTLILTGTIGVIAVFAFVYLGSYAMTSKAYYRIVR